MKIRSVCQERNLKLARDQILQRFMKMYDISVKISRQKHLMILKKN